MNKLFLFIYVEFYLPSFSIISVTLLGVVLIFAYLRFSVEKRRYTQFENIEFRTLAILQYPFLLQASSFAFQCSIPNAFNIRYFYGLRMYSKSAFTSISIECISKIFYFTDMSNLRFLPIHFQK